MADPKPGNISLNNPLNGSGDGIRAVGDCMNNLFCYETTETVTKTESGGKAQAGTPPKVTTTSTTKTHRGCLKMFIDSPAFPLILLSISIGLAARGRIGNI